MPRTAIQQIMIGSLCKTDAGAAQTLAAIKAAGYDGIELNDFMCTPTPFVVRVLTRAAGMPVGGGGKLDWPKLVREAGLDVVSLHTNLGGLKENPEKTIELAHTFGTRTIVITGMYRFDYSDRAAVEGLTQDLNACGKELAGAGMQLLYHNHNCELRRVNAQKRAYDILLEETDPRFVNFEFDSYWFTEGGANALAWMQRLGPRMKLWHINDRGCARLAAIHHTEEDAAALRKTLEGAKASLDVPFSFQEYDVAFHTALAAASHNTLAIMINKVIVRLNTEVHLRAIRDYTPEQHRATNMRIYETHYAIMEAVLARDPDGADRAVTPMVEFFQSVVYPAGPDGDSRPAASAAARPGR